MKPTFFVGSILVLSLLLLLPCQNYAGDKIFIDNKLEALAQGDYSAKKISYDPVNDVIVITYEYTFMDSVVAAISKDKGKTWSYYYRYLSTSSGNNPSVVAGFNKNLNKSTDYIVFNGFFWEGIKNPIMANFDQGGYDSGNWYPETIVSGDSSCWLPSPDLDEDGNLYIASYEPYNPSQGGGQTSGINFIKASSSDLKVMRSQCLLHSQKAMGLDSLGKPVFEAEYQNMAPVLAYGSNGTAYVMSNVRDMNGTTDLLHPAYWKTTDYGATWSGMQWVPLAGLPLNPNAEVELQGGYDLVVDKNNNPHFVAQVRRDTTISTSAENVYIDDSFDNDDLATNPNGTGSGFITYLQGTAKAEEYDGDMILTGNANWDIASAYGKDTFPFFTDNGVKLTFDLSNCNKPDPTGNYRAYLGISSTNECSFPPEAGDRIKGSGGAGLWLLGDGDQPFRWYFYYESNGRKNISEGTLATYKGGAPLTITMVLNNQGWSFAASGNEGSGSGTWPAGFWDGQGDAYVGVAAQGGITNLELSVTHLKAEAVVSSAAQNAYVDDTFDNNDLSTNPFGIGSGFISYLQGTAKAEEYDGDLILTGNANWDIASVYSKETLPFFTEQGAKLTFDITDCNKPDPTGNYRAYLGISSTNECSFPPEAGDRIKGSGGAGLWLLGDGDQPFRWIFYYESNGRKNISEGTLATYKGGAPLTITMLLNKNGWSFTASGGEGNASGTWPDGFWDGKGEAYVGAAAQGGITNLELSLAHLKAEPGVSSTVIYDSFDDDNIGANPNGTGSGFTAVTQGVAKAEEYDGDLILTGDANWDISSAYSKEMIPFYTDGGAKLTFQISDCVKPDPAGSYRFYVGLSSTNEYSFKVGAGDRPAGVSSCAIRFTGDGQGPFQWALYHEVNRSRVNIATGKMKSYQGGGPLTITMILNNKGWSFNISGDEAAASGTWPAGFWDGLGEAYVATCVEGAIDNLALFVGSIKAELMTTSAIVDDSFDDGDLAVNANGVGSGFTTYLQGTAKAEEYDGDMILTGNANWDIASAYTKDAFDFFNEDGAKLTFDITNCDKPDPTGNYRAYLGISSTNECSFPPEAGDRIKGSGGAGLWLLGDGDQPFRWYFYYESNGRKNIAEGTLATYKGGAPITITMNLNSQGWSFTASGNEGSGSGTWPAGFWNGQGDAYVGVAAQGGITNLALMVGSIKVEVTQAGGGSGSKITRAVRDIYDLHFDGANWMASRVAIHHATDYFQYKDPQSNVQAATDSEGNLFVMWAGFAKGTGNAVQSDVFLCYSTDGGKTWSKKANMTNTPDVDEAVVNLADKVGDQLHFTCQTIETYELLHNRYWLGTLYYMNYDNPAKGLLVSGNPDVPLKFQLSQNYPNPFNPTTSISYSIPKADQVRINIYNIQGELVRTLLDAKKESGNYRVDWDGTDRFGRVVASGVYLYRIETTDFTKTKKMSLLK